MTIQLPRDLENSIEAMVTGGQFASIDDAMAEAAHLLLREIKLRGSAANTAASLGSIGAMRDAADELD